MSTPTDEDLLRVIAHVTLGHIPSLVGEGLDVDAVTQVTSHAMALAERAFDLETLPEGCRTHAVGLWELLAVLNGPVSGTLLNWLDEALGSGVDRQEVLHGRDRPEQ